MTDWTFFTNHGHVLFVLADNPKLTTREISEKVGITERATQRIISELAEDSFIRIEKEGRNNRYVVSGKRHLRHQIEKHCRISDLIDVVRRE